jgi:hypothetical protein
MENCLRISAILLLVGGMAWGCYEDPPSAPVAFCLHPDEWVEQTCEEFCEGRDSVCVEAPECGDMAVAGYKRLDACPELEFHTPLSRGCDDVLPESLTESVYIVSCCCTR